MKILFLIISAVLVLALGITSCAPFPAIISVTELSVVPTQIQCGEKVIITVGVANSGGTEGTYHLRLYINHKRYAEEDMVVAAGSTESTTYSVIINEAGSYTVTAGGLAADFSAVAPELEPVDESECDYLLQVYAQYKAEAAQNRYLAESIRDLANKALYQGLLDAYKEYMDDAQYYMDKVNHAEDQARGYYAEYLECLDKH